MARMCAAVEAAEAAEKRDRVGRGCEARKLGAGAGVDAEGFWGSANRGG